MTSLTWNKKKSQCQANPLQARKVKSPKQWVIQVKSKFDWEWPLVVGASRRRGARGQQRSEKAPSRNNQGIVDQQHATSGRRRSRSQRACSRRKHIENNFRLQF